MRMSIDRTPAAGVFVFVSLCLVALLGLLTVPVAGAATNQPPTISGTPPSSVSVGSQYNFRPSASDPEGATLRFSITNKPWWASFSISSGQLVGTPRVAGYWGNIQIRVSDGLYTRSLPAFAIRAASTSNRAPTISGTPAKSVIAGSAYSFRPTASDPDGNPLTFTIQNRPAWASFNTSNGTLSGTPSAANVGTYSSIVITVSDGRSSASLPAFGITVTDIASGSATLSWTPPTANSDGSTLTNLAGYRIYHGTSPSALNRTVQVANAGIATYVIGNLSPGTWYFSVRAYNSSGVESAPSNVVSKTIN